MKLDGHLQKIEQMTQPELKAYLKVLQERAANLVGDDADDARTLICRIDDRLSNSNDCKVTIKLREARSAGFLRTYDVARDGQMIPGMEVRQLRTDRNSDRDEKYEILMDGKVLDRCVHRSEVEPAIERLIMGSHLFRSD